MPPENDAGFLERHMNGVHLGHCLHEQDWGELRAMLPGIASKIDAILAQAIATNGRVRSLETALAWGKGALAVVVVLELLPKIISTLVKLA